MALKQSRLTIAEIGDLSLQYLAENPEQLGEFMVQSGIRPADLRRLVGTHEFIHGLMDYVVGNEPLLIAIATANDLQPESIAAAWMAHHHAHEH